MENIEPIEDTCCVVKLDQNHAGGAKDRHASLSVPCCPNRKPLEMGEVSESQLDASRDGGTRDKRARDRGKTPSAVTQKQP